MRSLEAQINRLQIIGSRGTGVVRRTQPIKVLRYGIQTKRQVLNLLI